MEHEQQLSPEQLERHPKPVFNFEQMAPTQAANLVAVIGNAYKLTAGSDEEQDKVSQLQAFIDHDIADLPARNLEKARELYTVMANHEEAWPRCVAVCHVETLVAHLSQDYSARQQVIDLWLRLCNDEDDMVAEFAKESMFLAVEGEDLLDEPLRRYLNSKLPHGSQSLRYADE